MKTRTLIVFMMAALFVSSVTLAQGPEQKKNRMDRRAMMNRQKVRHDFGQKLGLTDEQKEAMKKIRLETAKEVKPLKNELRELQAHQQSLVTADNADMKAIYKNIDKMSDVKTNLAKIMAKQTQEVRSLLTDEQRLKMDQMRSHMQRNERPFIRTRMESRDMPAFGKGA